MHAYRWHYYECTNLIGAKSDNQKPYIEGGCLMVFNATFNNISVTDNIKVKRNRTKKTNHGPQNAIRTPPKTGSENVLGNSMQSCFPSGTVGVTH